MTAVGAPLDRVDGAAKVTGSARYAGDFAPPGTVHAVMVTSTVASGTVASIETARATKAPGVLAVMTHANSPRLPERGEAALDPPAGRRLTVLQDGRVHFQRQPVAVVIAERLEQAQHAASLVAVRYRETQARLDFERASERAHQPKKAGRAEADSLRGDPDAAFGKAPLVLERTYSTPFETHNPLEPHATVAEWQDGLLTLWDATQYVSGVRETVAKTLGLEPESVRVISPFVGGGFGCKGAVWSHVVLAAMAARHVGRPVKLVLERGQMFGPVGGRPRTHQRLRVGASKEGELLALRHDVVSATSTIEDWTEPSAVVTRKLYAVPSLATSHRLAKLSIGTPTFQRAPGEASGSFALESLLDELAHELRVDPIALRLRNEPATDPESGRPWSSRSLTECFRVGAERFGWTRRSPAPRSMRDGAWLVGYGVGAATYPMNRSAASARARLERDGTVVVESGTQDIGTGTYTIGTQIAADALGLPTSRVRFVLGDTSLPRAPVSGGSMTAASVGPAVQEACAALRRALVARAIADPASPLVGLDAARVTLAEDAIVSLDDDRKRDTLAALAQRAGERPIEIIGEAKPADEAAARSMHSFGAVFAEVRVDPELGRVEVRRVVGAYGVGRVLNAKTARSQLQGGLVWGVSMALLEEAHFDPGRGRVVNANLSEYLVPVNADIHDMEVIFVAEDDPHVNPLGAKGIGEIGITGIVGAIANAVFHATGRRIRDLPITADKLV